MKLLSVILPAYNEEKMIEKARDTLGRVLSEQDIPYEIVFVDDGSKDQTWSEIEKAAEKDDYHICYCNNHCFDNSYSDYNGKY